MTEQLVPITQLLDVSSGEVLPANIANAGRVIQAARDMKNRIGEVIAQATAYLAEESARQGTRTLSSGTTQVTLSGGTTTDYDPVDLRMELEFAGCPENRIEEAIVAEVTYKVNRTVLRQLAGANSDYKAAIERSAREVEKPYRVSIKGA